MHRYWARSAAAAVLGMLGCSTDEPSTEADPTTSTTVLVTTTEPPATATTSSISAETQAFLDAGNAICADMNQRIQDEVVASYPAGGPSTPAEIADAADRTADLIEEAVAGLRGLDSPPGEETEVEALVVRVENLLDVYREFAEAVRAGDQVRVAELSDQVTDLTAGVNHDYAAYGLTACAE